MLLAITVILAILKLCAVPYIVSASWWLITAPVWMPLCFSLVVALLAACGLVGLTSYERRLRKR